MNYLNLLGQCVKGDAGATESLLKDGNGALYLPQGIKECWYAASERGFDDVIGVLSRFTTADERTRNMSFVLAATKGHLSTVRMLSEMEGVDPGYENNSAIRFASEKGHFGVVQFLVSLPSVDPTAEENEAFRLACKNGYENVVRFLASVPGVDPTAKDNEGLMMASRGRKSIVKFLLSLPGVRANAKALRSACKYDNIPIMKMLLESDSELKLTVADNYCIRKASEKGSLDMVRFIVETDGDVDIEAAIPYAKGEYVVGGSSVLFAGRLIMFPRLHEETRLGREQVMEYLESVLKKRKIRKIVRRKPQIKRRKV